MPAACLLFRGPILSYTRGVFIVQNPPCERESKRECTEGRNGHERTGQPEEREREKGRERKRKEEKRVELQVARIRAGKRRKRMHDEKQRRD